VSRGRSSSVADFGSLDERADRQELNHIDALKKAVARIETAQARLITKLELDDDPEGILFQRVRTRLSELEDERREKISTLRELEASKSETPDAEAVKLLDGLPLGESGLPSAPEDLLRQLFNALRLEVRFNNVTNQALCRVTMDEGSADRLPNTLPPRAQRSARRSA
jgi:site-specific DNA recombinase